ncbi:hypothetical protein [Solibacillus sp. NPDC093137]|uniref:hypothetical protein n=1 Tax=Solibacillus sp. NPDC093137 TaxID=3390678 RepID=UPI003CFC39F4
MNLTEEWILEQLQVEVELNSYLQKQQGIQVMQVLNYNEEIYRDEERSPEDYSVYRNCDVRVRLFRATDSNNVTFETMDLNFYKCISAGDGAALYGNEVLYQELVHFNKRLFDNTSFFELQSKQKFNSDNVQVSPKATVVTFSSKDMDNALIQMYTRGRQPISGKSLEKQLYENVFHPLLEKFVAAQPDELEHIHSKMEDSQYYVKHFRNEYIRNIHKCLPTFKLYIQNCFGLNQYDYFFSALYCLEIDNYSGKYRMLYDRNIMTIEEGIEQISNTIKYNNGHAIQQFLKATND